MPNGVEIHGKKLRIYFPYEGEKCREPLDLEPTKGNRAYAENMVKMIRHEIHACSFVYSKYFPNSKRLVNNRLSFYLDSWLKIKKQQVADSTYRSYANKINCHIRPKFGMRQTDSIDYIEVESWIAEEMAKLSSKTIKDTVALLRSVYDLYRKRRPNAIDPTHGVRVKLPDDDDPDPFNREEIEKILSTTPRNERHQELNLAKFLLWAGPRVSEGIALAWEDVIELDKGLVQFQRARVRGIFKATKTKRSKRLVELVKPARVALQAQYAITGGLPPVQIDVKNRDNRTVRQEKLRFVFLNSNTMQPHISDFNLRDRFFKAHLKRAGVRYRGPGQCRHTYISQMLTCNMPIEWISKQAGTSTEMIRRRYGKWMLDDADDMIAIAEKRLKL